MFHDVSKGHQYGMRDVPPQGGGQHGHGLTAPPALRETLLTSVFQQPNWVINGVRFSLGNSELTQDVSGVSNEQIQ